MATKTTRSRKQVMTPDLGDVGAQDEVTETAKPRRRVKQAPSTTVAAPVVPAKKPTANSIRSLITGELKAGTDVKTIKELIVKHFPNSAAAAKSAKHISFYKSILKRDGLLPAKAPVTTQA